MLKISHDGGEGRRGMQGEEALASPCAHVRSEARAHRKVEAARAEAKNRQLIDFDASTMIQFQEMLDATGSKAVVRDKWLQWR